MDINLHLVLQEPIDFYGVKIYQPTIQDIFDYGIEEYNQLIIPYSLTWDLLNIPEEQAEAEGFKYFDIIVSDRVTLDLLIKSLKYFCKTDNIKFVETGIQIREGIINRDNFDDFGDVILKINAREKHKTEKSPIFENDRQRDIWTKLQEGRKRNAKKDELHLYDILNIIEFGGKFHIPISLIKQWTLWRIMNAYKCILSRDNYDSSFSIYLVSGEKSLIEDKHWTQQIKVN